MHYSEYILFSFLVLAFILLSFFPLATFLLLFSSLGNIVLRWLRRKPGKRHYRFDLRSLMIGMAWVGVSIATTQALADTHSWGVLWLNWVLLSPLLSFGICVTRYLVDSWDERKLARSQKLHQQSTGAVFPEEEVQSDNVQ